MATHKAFRDMSASPRAVRSPSLSSDVPSTRSSAAQALPDANPPPSFVANAEAALLVSTEVEDNVTIKEQALVLLNAFLDNILYNILSTAKSARLGRLRDAVPLVLKPRLGKAALNAADEELREYLDGGDDEILSGGDSRPEPGNNFDLELAWKLARLRCMVYTRLGDMEEEDEEEFLESEQLNPGSGPYPNAAHQASSVKAASAIFLTSVLEYLGEQALLYAVQNTQKRAQTPKPQAAIQLDGRDSMTLPDHQSLVLDESDMFYVGRESPLSRLWRTWRRQTRSLADMTSNTSPKKDYHSHSASTEMASQIEENAAQEEIQDSGLPHQVPLPMSANDVNEIEVPGLAREIVDDGEAPSLMPVSEPTKKRPVSMIAGRWNPVDQFAAESEQAMTVKQKRRSRPYLGHKRSMSHPVPEKQTFVRGPETVAPQQKPDAEATLDVDDVEEASFGPSNPDARDGVAQAEPEVQSEEKGAANEQRSSGLVATVVSAAAGTLGLGALAAAAAPKDKKSTEPQAKPLRTVADKMIGTTEQVAPPKDAVTGSSITTVGDFDNLHIPVEKPRTLQSETTSPKLDSSDPEDLALSSGDEDTLVREPRKMGAASSHNHHPAEVSTLPEASGASHSKSTETAIDPSNVATPINKSVSQQEAASSIPQQSVKDSTSATSTALPDRPLWGPVNNTSSHHGNPPVPVISPSTSAETVIHRNALSPIYAQPQAVVVRDTPSSRPSTASTTVRSSVPQRLSSDPSGVDHSRTDSKSSQYSQESKHSSASSKLLGLNRDSARHSKASSIPDAATNGVQSYGVANAGPLRDLVSSNTRPVKKPLRVETEAGPEKNIDDAEAKKKSLEILIRGDETLHYTLTPVSARAEHFPISKHSPDSSRNLSSRDGYGKGHVQTTSTASNTMNGIRAAPAKEKAPLPSSRVTTAAYASASGGTPALASTQAKPKTNRIQPRDARLDNTTMTDLADYARSTGPANEQQLPRALSSRPGTGATVKTVKSTANTIATMPIPPVPATRPMTQQSHGSKSVGARTKFQAREPTVSRRSETNDLIAFLREGPPATNGTDGHVSNGNPRSSATSTQNSSVAPRSVRESANSSTALLASNRPQSKKVNGMSTGHSAAVRNVSSHGDLAPARKQRRVRDPYAIDDSDDDLDELQSPAEARRTADETLIDFLRNTAPPPGSSPPPILAASPNYSANVTAAGAVKRQSSSQGLRERIMRSTSRSSMNGQASTNNSQPNARSDNPPHYHRGADRARAVSPHLVQTGKKLDAYKPTSATYAPHVDRNRSQMKARGPTSSSRNDTSDLAEYLKNSGPPQVPAGRERPSSVVSEEAGFLKFFSRRKAMKS